MVENEIDALKRENSMLRAKIAAFESRTPIAWMSSRNGFICKENKNPEYNIPLGDISDEPTHSVSNPGTAR